MIKLIQMLLIFVFEIRPRDRLQNDSDAMTVFIIISLSPRDYRSELFNVGCFPTGILWLSHKISENSLKVYCLPHLYFFIPKIIVVFRTDLHKMKIKHRIIGEYATKR